MLTLKTMQYLALQLNYCSLGSPGPKLTSDVLVALK